MGRSNFNYTVTTPVGPGGSLLPLEGVSATVYLVNPDGSQGAATSTYNARNGSTPGNQTTDSNGNVSFWLPTGDYNVQFVDTISPARISPFVVGFDPVQVSDAEAAMDSVTWYSGDLKWSTQPGDHGLVTEVIGSEPPIILEYYTWLLLSSNASNGAGRSVSYTLYPGLWAMMGSPTPDSNGNFNLPNPSGRTLVATGLGEGLSSWSMFADEGAESVSISHDHTLSDNAGAGFWYYEQSGDGVGVYIVFPDNGGEGGGPGFTASRFSGELTFGAISGAPPGTGGSIPLLGATDEWDSTINNWQPSYGMNLFIHI